MTQGRAAGLIEDDSLRVDPETGFVDVLVRDGNVLRPARSADIAEEYGAAGGHQEESGRELARALRLRAR